VGTVTFFQQEVVAHYQRSCVQGYMSFAHAVPDEIWFVIDKSQGVGAVVDVYIIINAFFIRIYDAVTRYTVPGINGEITLQSPSMITVAGSALFQAQGPYIILAVVGRGKFYFFSS